jgi:hypothetical protein
MDVRLPDGTVVRNVPEGITKSQLNEKLARRGTTPPAPASSYTPGIGDYAQQFAQGATFDLADELGSGLAAGAMAMKKGKLSDLGSDYQAGLEGVRADQKEFQQNRPTEAMGMRLAGGLATGVAGAGTKTGATVLNSLRSGGTAERIGKAAVAGATSGGLYGFGAGEGSDVAGSTVSGAVGGAIGGAALPAAPAAAGAIGRTVVPGLEQEAAQLGKRAKDLGIDLRLDQVSPSRVRKTVQKVSQEVPFSGVEKFEQKQSKQWHRALSKTIGEDSDNLGPTTIQAFRKNNSDKFGEAFKGQQFNFTNMVKGDLMKIADEAKGTIDDGLAKIVKENVNSTWNQLKSGTLSGEKLASIRSELLRKTTRMKNAAAPFVGDIIDKLDDIAEAQMPEASRKSLGEARRQWRNFKTVQPLLEKSTDGNINPTQLLNRVAANKYIDASKIPTGEDELVDLARIGNKFMQKAGGSDTFQKMALGGAGLAAFTNPALLGKAAIGVGANRLFQGGVNQNQFLVNQAIKNAQGRTALELQPYSEMLRIGK